MTKIGPGRQMAQLDTTRELRSGQGLGLDWRDADLANQGAARVIHPGPAALVKRLDKSAIVRQCTRSGDEERHRRATTTTTTSCHPNGQYCLALYHLHATERIKPNKPSFLLAAGPLARLSNVAWEPLPPPSWPMVNKGPVGG
jgi:hypothetical protein